SNATRRSDRASSKNMECSRILREARKVGLMAQGAVRFRCSGGTLARARDGIRRTIHRSRLTPARRGFIVHESEEIEMSGMRFAGVICGVAMAFLLAAPAAAGPVERLFTQHHGYVPACDSSWALGIISWRFGYKERRFWGSAESLSHFGPVREIAYRPW